jgi:hypothetical protein
VNVLDYPGADLGAKIQAAFNARLQTAGNFGGAGLAQGGLALLVPDNPAGGPWDWSTPVDLGYYTAGTSTYGVAIIGLGSPMCVAGAACVAAGYMLRVGQTAKTDHFRIENITFDPGAADIQCAIYFNSGTHPIFRNISFHKSTTKQFTHGILIAPTVTFSYAGPTNGIFESINDTGGSACKTSMIDVSDGVFISNRVSNMRIGPTTTYGIMLVASNGAILGNEISNIAADAGGGVTTTALVYLFDNGQAIAWNHIHSLNGNSNSTYGVLVAQGGANITNNEFDIPNYSFATSSFHDSGSGLRATLANIVQPLRGTASWTPGLIAGLGFANTSVTVTGAELGDFAIASYDHLLTAGLELTVQVSANDTAIVQIYNSTVGGITPTAGNTYVKVYKRISLIS